MKFFYALLLLAFFNVVSSASAQNYGEAYERAKVNQGGAKAAQHDATRAYLENMRNHPPENAPTADNAQPNGEMLRSKEFSRSAQAKEELAEYWDGLTADGRVRYCNEIRPGCLKDHLGYVCQLYYRQCFKQ